MKIILTGDRHLVTNACLSKDLHGYKLLINTRDRWIAFSYWPDEGMVVWDATDDDNDLCEEETQRASITFEFDSTEEDFTKRAMHYMKQEKDQIEVRWLSFDGMDSANSVVVTSNCFDGDQ